MVKLITGRRTNLSHSEGIRETIRTLLRATLYNPAMNKRARKRLKEAIEKKNLERQKMLKEQSSASSQTKERRGFTVKPEKKRG
jgi:nitric oxide reductase activation protein